MSSQNSEGSAPKPTTKRAKLTRRERKEKKAKQKAAKLIAKERTEVIYAADKTLVEVTSKGYSFRGVPHELVVGASRFSRDYTAAFSVRCAGFEPGVDGGRSHEGHLAAVASQQRLRQLREKIGQRDYDIIEAVVICGFGPADLHRAGGPKIDVISNDITRILRRVLEFYSGRPSGPDKLHKAAHNVVQAIGFGQEPALADLRELWKRAEAGR